MANKEIHLTEINLLEWMHSTGYFLPCNEVESERFNILHLDLDHSIKEEQVDPISILNGAWKPKAINKLENISMLDDESELRMAARKHQGLPNDIIEKMKKNQKSNGASDNGQS